jgi:hypothetical protein
MRGWDQALITSQLEEDDDELASRAQTLRQRLGPARRRIVALLGNDTLCYEARIMAASAAGREIELACEAPERLSALLAEPSVAAILLRATVAPKSGIETLTTVIRRAGRGDCPLVMVHACGLEPESLARGQDQLRKAGAIVCDSNAAAARLAAFVVVG